MSEIPKRVVHLALRGALTTLSLLAGCTFDEAVPQHNDDGVLALARGPKIESVTLTGQACAAADPSTIRISGTRETFWIDFEDFIVSARSKDDARSTECIVTLVLEGESGTAYAPAGLNIDVSTSSVSTVSTTAYWTSEPGVRSEDVYTSRSPGRYAWGALDDRTLWSSCSGPRELRFTIRLGLGERSGRAEVERLSALRFYGRTCSAADSGDAALPGTDGSSDAGVADADSPPDAALGELDSGAPAESDASQAGDDGGSGSGVTISSLRARGTGCPAANTDVHIAEGRDTFDIDFGSFSSEAAAERDLPSLNCIIVASLEVPNGKTVALEGFEARGWASLPEGSSARLFGTHSFVAAAGTGPMAGVTLAGPREGGFQLSAAFSGSELLFRPCGQARDLSLNLSLVTEDAQSGVPLRARVDALSGIRFQLRDCP